MLNYKKIKNSFDDWATQQPFPYAIADNFFSAQIARQLSKEFPSFEDSIWHEYNSPIEIKKTLNIWNLFPPATYHVFSYLNSYDFISRLAGFVGIDTLIPDHGLNGGG